MTIKERYKIISKEAIDTSLKYLGYYWYSNKPKPSVLNNEFIPKGIFDKPDAFIVEGNLYNDQEKISYQIKNIDGEYHIARIDLKGLEEEGIDYKNIDYFTHDIKGEYPDFIKYTLVEAWEEVPLYPSSKNDLELPDMMTLVPAWSAFKGFKKY